MEEQMSKVVSFSRFVLLTLLLGLLIGMGELLLTI
jgi:hypothetical protein